MNPPIVSFKLCLGVGNDKYIIMCNFGEFIEEAFGAPRSGRWKQHKKPGLNRRLKIPYDHTIEPRFTDTRSTRTPR